MHHIDLANEADRYLYNCQYARAKDALRRAIVRAEHMGHHHAVKAYREKLQAVEFEEN